MPYLYEEIDDFIMPTIQEFDGKKMVEINKDACIGLRPDFFHPRRSC
ncbi:MAG: hypothetical protein HN745_15615 [Deltaproteobacteria bacterium]|nr:hypothetical protein [Deltaproteobacteria bacterium]MBT7713150.1 hypothetical protein [Deltaproteobacteria bacterium]